MKLTETCINCLYRRQKEKHDDEGFLAAVREIIDNRSADDCAPYLSYQFRKMAERQFGEINDYRQEKRFFNDFMLAREREIEEAIEAADDPIKKALAVCRAANYIDMVALKTVEPDKLVVLLKEASWSRQDDETYRQFARDLEKGNSLVILADNCGEIVMDKLLIRQIRKRYPQIKVSVMVRGEETINDATVEDAVYVGMDEVAQIVPNGQGITGTVYKLLPEEARKVFDGADVILSKGMGNYEALSGIEKRIYYMFLCKCEQFISYFAVPQFTGIFTVEE
ncbi:MAG: DUF89 family protein [Erysipelotrichaceae bacterium]|nr:DUF89 family protein [Erysipelotrichaceae bacterium]